MTGLSINFKKLTYREFYSLINKICMNTFNEEVKSNNSTQLYMKLKWYCEFIHYFIKQNRIIKMNDFEKILTNNKYFETDAEMTIKAFNIIRQVLIAEYTLIDIIDISNFCSRVCSEIKV